MSISKEPAPEGPFLVWDERGVCMGGLQPEDLELYTAERGYLCVPESQAKAAPEMYEALEKIRAAARDIMIPALNGSSPGLWAAEELQCQAAFAAVENALSPPKGSSDE